VASTSERIHKPPRTLCGASKRNRAIFTSAWTAGIPLAALGYPRGAAETVLLISPLVGPLWSLAIAGTAFALQRAWPRMGAHFTVRRLQRRYDKNDATKA